MQKRPPGESSTWSRLGVWIALGAPFSHLVAFLGEVRAAGVDLYLHQQALDTLTPAGKAMLQMCGVFAEFERAMIVERVNAGLRRAKAASKVLGAPEWQRREPALH
jgi:DNA invertase Pin-like site-specific DNA recombinase